MNLGCSILESWLVLMGVLGTLRKFEEVLDLSLVKAKIFGDRVRCSDWWCLNCNGSEFRFRGVVMRIWVLNLEVELVRDGFL
ncbi:hypothetical protein Droror1_Dr00002715, partial [Drosera rotundifolia]